MGLQEKGPAAPRRFRARRGATAPEVRLGCLLELLVDSCVGCLLTGAAKTHQPNCHGPGRPGTPFPPCPTLVPQCRLI